MHGQILKAVWPRELCAVPCQTDAAVCLPSELPSLSYTPSNIGGVLTKCPLLSWWELSRNSGVIHTTCVLLALNSTFFNAGVFPLKFQNCIDIFAVGQEDPMAKLPVISNSTC